MENQNDQKQSGKVFAPQPRVNKHAKTSKKDKTLIGALILLVATAGFFVYMWYEMRSQLADNRDNTILLAQEIERLKDEAEQDGTRAPSIRVIAEEYQKMLTAARENPVDEAIDEKKVLAAAAASQKNKELPEKANVLAVYNRDKSKDDSVTALVYWPGKDNKSGVFLEAVKAVNGTWKALNPLTP